PPSLASVPAGPRLPSAIHAPKNEAKSSAVHVYSPKVTVSGVLPSQRERAGSSAPRGPISSALLKVSPTVFTPLLYVDHCTAMRWFGVTRRSRLRPVTSTTSPSQGAS